MKRKLSFYLLCAVSVIAVFAAWLNARPSIETEPSESVQELPTDLPSMEDFSEIVSQTQEVPATVPTTQAERTAPQTEPTRARTPGASSQTTVPTTVKKPPTTAVPTTTGKPTVTAAPTTTKRPSTTAAPTTTQRPKVTAPSTTKKPSTTSGSQNNAGGSLEIGVEAEMLRRVNAERSANGLRSLQLSEELNGYARIRAREIAQAGHFSHTRPDGSSALTIIPSYSYAGENIAYGQRNVSAVMDGWMNSSGHRANILGKSFTQLGVGCYRASNGTLYWVQLFKG